MKKITFFFFFVFIYNTVFASCGPTELCIVNLTPHKIWIRYYPESMLFNGRLMYNLVCNYRDHERYDYINTVASPRNGIIPSTQDGLYFWEVDVNEGYIGFYDDHDNANSGAQGHYGYGVYKLEIYYPYVTEPYYDSCIVERDFDSGSSTDGDLRIEIYGRGETGTDEAPNAFISYRFDASGNTFPKIYITSYVFPEYKIDYWKPYGQYTPPYRNKVYGPPTQNNFFIYKNEPDPDFNLYSELPLDSRMKCYKLGIDYNQFFPGKNTEPIGSDERQGILTLNLLIQKSISTPVLTYMRPYGEGLSSPMPVIITPNCTLKLDNNITYTLSNIENNVPGIFVLNNKGYGKLILGNGSIISVGDNFTNRINKNKVVLDCHSKLEMGANSSFNIYPGGLFCNQGADVTGILKINLISGPFKHNYIQCAVCDQISSHNDSTQITLLDSAKMEIPDNITLSFSDPSTMLIMKPNSELILGNNSKLTFTNGARLIADHATFTSIDSNGTWDGIYLEDNSNDTITNCTIENASNGINIIDKTSLEIEQPSTEISNCTFRNTTTTQLTNAVYINNSYNVLLKGNSISATQLTEGYLSGILAEYCPSGALNIVDNNIHNTLTGISIIQSSPYIARNIITGTEGTGKGIYIDNSNGILKYNVINNFVNSIVGNYSSLIC
jgi:parallel beta-helix repeat protein